ncbi:MAG: tRNA adenosine(34) deaminase TadA [Halieaceae bacterium]|nr:tRNA adenosine(34) deaminase TadA [Halieaceae bacterium]
MGGAAVMDDEAFMARALQLAAAAGANDEIPVGAVVVIDGEVVGEGANAQIATADPTAHAEVVALRDAAAKVGNYRLPGATLYVTLEPCTMCCGAMVHARVAELVFATREPKAGAVVSTANALDNAALNHQVRWREGPGREASANLLRDFFRARRAAARGAKPRASAG